MLVEDREHAGGHRRRPEPGRHRQCHRHDLLREIELAIDHLVADQRDTRDLLQLHVQSLAAEQPELFRVDQRGGAGDRQEADVERFLFDRALRAGFLRERLERIQRDHRRDRGQGGAGAYGLEKFTAIRGIRKHPGEDRLIHSRRERLFLVGRPLCQHPQFRRRVAHAANAVTGCVPHCVRLAVDRRFLAHGWLLGRVDWKVIISLPKVGRAARRLDEVPIQAVPASALRNRPASAQSGPPSA